MSDTFRRIVDLVRRALKLETGPKGEMSLAARKKIEFGRRESFLWTADGRGLLFVAGDEFRLERIP